MALMAWSSLFETGLPTVDSQHHKLVDLINKAAPLLALDEAQAQQIVSPLLDNLVRYAAVHFRDEECLMADKGLEPSYRQQHYQVHQAFVEAVTHMRQQYESQVHLSGKELLRFLTSWLSFHILLEDHRMSRQITDIEAGVSPQQALANVNAPVNAAQDVVNSALLDMFALLTERNRALTLANEQIQRTQRALEETNQSLEVRVQERTHELAATVERLKQMQDQLLQAGKMAAVGQLAAGVAHEINNPIGFVNSNLSSLTDYVAQLLSLIAVCQSATESALPEQRAIVAAACKKIDLDYLREDLPVLLRESREGLDRVKTIVQGLRNFSHKTDGKPTGVDVNRIIKTALSVAAGAFKGKVAVQTQLADVPEVVCIESEISQVVVNLLVNAAQAIDAGGVVTVRSGVSGEQVWLEVTDTGCGMSEEVKSRIFEPFYTTKPVGTGTGLGLSLSWEIVERHHGTFEVHSAPGQGSTFRVSLPQAQTAA